MRVVERSGSALPVTVETAIRPWPPGQLRLANSNIDLKT